MNTIAGVLVGLVLIGFYVAAALAGARWADRRGWRYIPQLVAAIVAGLYAPVWVPVWAVGRWMGLWPKPKDTGPPWRQGVPTIHVSGMKDLEPSDVPLRKPRFYPFT